MAITAAMVKELRERTGLGMMDCKKALTAAAGDMEQAIDDLRKSSALKAAKKASRTAAEGLLGMKIAADNSKGTLVEVNIETDFAAKNDRFIAFVGDVLEAAFAAEVDDVEALLAGPIGASRQALVQEIGENITVRRVSSLNGQAGEIAGYLHSDQRKGAMVALTGGSPELGRDIAMHITGIDPAPVVIRGSDVPAETVAQERAVYVAQAADSGKPPEIVEKMVEGRVRKFLAEISLLDQPFVKDPNQKISALLKSAGGADCREFERYLVGDGIAVEKADFASEVAAQVEATK